MGSKRTPNPYRCTLHSDGGQYLATRLHHVSIMRGPGRCAAHSWGLSLRVVIRCGQERADHLCHHPVSIGGLISKEWHAYNWLPVIDGLHD